MSALNQVGEQIVAISDDSSAESELARDTGLTGITRDSKRRKVNHRNSDEPAFSEKVHLTDESDTAPRIKKRAKRRSSGRGKTKRNSDQHEGDLDDEPDLAAIPQYLQERRLEFDAKKRKHHEAALMLPPDYTGLLHLADDSRLPQLEERPQFEESSGVKRCRPYEDVDLPQSAGLIPASIAQYLRGYQIAGVRFLHKKFVYQEGGILGDDMGLGKTVQVAAFLTVTFGKTGDERDDKRMRQIRFDRERWYPRILIICPGSLIMNWKNELHRWGWWHIDMYHGPNKDDVLSTARAGLLEIMITTYDTYKNSRGKINMITWDAVIADECHRLKDPRSETTKAMTEVNALCRIGLTGTAIQNNYEELWTLLNWTNPGHFGTLLEWSYTISRPLAVGQSHEATAAQLSLARQTAQKLVQNLLPRYFLRRMKTLIADQLPKKTDRVVFCPLTDLQKDAYENFLDSAEITIVRNVSEMCDHDKAQGWCCRQFLPSGERWQSIVFPSMQVLQKLANHLILLMPNTTDTDLKHKNELRALRTCMPETWERLYQQRDQIRNMVNPEFCGKWKILKKLLKFWHANGDKVLVFSHSVRLLRILQHLFTNTSYSVSYLDGSLGYEQRQEVVDTFNSDPTQFVFLISTKAGGVGLNITSANKVVIVDPHWNPSYDLQAQDRAYRIGQTRDVEVFRLISLGTVEEIVYARQVYKQQQANIGYTASSERRYFRGVQHNSERKGEIFGLANIFTYHPNSGLLRDIVNKTNIAEAKAGVSLVDVDMEQAARDEETLGLVKHEDDKGVDDGEDGGLSQLANMLARKSQGDLSANATGSSATMHRPKSDAIQAILTAAGVEYTHDNAQVIGSSKVEEVLSRRAAEASRDGASDGPNGPLFAGDEDSWTASGGVLDDAPALHSVYRPPEDVMRRQFCDMSREFGFASVTEFALVVESWTGEARRNCLESFYRRRKEKMRVKSESEGTDADTSVVRDAEARPTSTSGLKQEPKVEVDVKGEAQGSKMDDAEAKTEHIPLKNQQSGKWKKEDIESVEEEAKVSTMESIEAVKMENVKSHTQQGVKTEAGASVKSEDVKPLKSDNTVKSESGSTTVKPEDVPEVKPKMEGTSKRTSIFLSDDEDDEL